jgi:hypothetical protein
MFVEAAVFLNDVSAGAHACQCCRGHVQAHDKTRDLDLFEFNKHHMRPEQLQARIAFGVVNEYSAGRI